LAGYIHVSNVLVDGRWVCATQGKDRSSLERAAEEVHPLMGRSLAQVNSRLFELAGSLYLSDVLHLQVSHLFAPNVAKDRYFLLRGHSFLALFPHDGVVSP
jgi:hypothetical protein